MSSTRMKGGFRNISQGVIKVCKHLSPEAARPGEIESISSPWRTGVQGLPLVCHFQFKKWHVLMHVIVVPDKDAN